MRARRAADRAQAQRELEQSTLLGLGRRFLTVAEIEARCAEATTAAAAAAAAAAAGAKAKGAAAAGSNHHEPPLPSRVRFVDPEFPPSAWALRGMPWADDGPDRPVDCAATAAAPKSLPTGKSAAVAANGAFLP